MHAMIEVCEMVEEKSMAAPVVNKECHGCFCECGECAASYHHNECNLYQCCAR